ncbi:MAG: DUF952 domain-containing protein [Chitinophagaceae bacterium]|nr:DUF952 domain-containing protein [Chitinophagaceae bacterium]
MIYHVTTQHKWDMALQQGYYEADSLHTEGFIHMSRAEQVEGVLMRYYQGQTGLLLLHIDELNLKAQLIEELATSVNEKFPHLYGRLNLDAVINAELL